MHVRKSDKQNILLAKIDVLIFILYTINTMTTIKVDQKQVPWWNDAVVYQVSCQDFKVLL